MPPGDLVIGVLVALAVRADSEAPAVSPWLTAMDVAVGLAFAAGGHGGQGAAPRTGLDGRGPAWLVGSFLHALVVAAPDPLRGRLRSLTTHQLVIACGRLRLRAHGDIETTTFTASLRVLARRIQLLQAEIAEHTRPSPP